MIKAAPPKVVFPGRPLALALGLSTAFAIGIVGYARSQDAGSQIGQASRTSSFNIPAQPLPSALTVFGRQAGLQVIADPAVVEGRSSGAVSGTLTAEEALGRILTGTGISYRFTSATSVTIAAPGQSGLPLGAMQLDPVQVQGIAPPRQAEIGNLPPAYPGGEVARGQRIGILGNRDYMDTPFSATSYTEKYIQDNQARTLIDVVANDPSIRPVYPQSAWHDTMLIRGFSLSPYDIAFNGLYGVNPRYSIPLAGIERVEVFRGPSAMLSGMPPQGAVGGTINLVPKRAPDAGIAQATASYIMNSQVGGEIDFGRRFGPDNALGLRVNAAYSGGNTTVANQADSLLNLTVGFDYRGTDTRLDADFGFAKRNMFSPQVGTGLAAGLQLPAAPNAAGNYYQPWEYYNFNSTYGMLRFEHDFTPSLTAFAKAGGSRSSSSFLFGFPIINTSAGATTATPIGGVSWYENVSAEAGVRAKLQTGALRHELALSGSYLISWIGDERVAAPPAVASNIYSPLVQPQPNLGGIPTGAPTSSQSVLSSIALIDAVSAVNNRIQLIGGVRFQQVQVSNWDTATGFPAPGYAESAVTPTVSLIVKPWEKLSFYGNFIQALEQGAVADPGLTNAGTVFPPFVSTQFEAGAKVDLGDFGATLSLFQITRQSSFVNPITNSLVVDGQQRNSGIEFTMFGEPVKGVRPLGGFLLLNPVLTSTANGTNNGHYAPGVPRFQANLGVDWDTPFVQGLTLGGRVVYTGGVFLDPANLQPVPPWTRVDLSAKYSFDRADGKPIALRAQVINVGNNNYWMATSGLLAMGKPRTFMLSLTADF